MNRIDWPAAEEALWRTGFASLGKLLTAEQTAGLISLYPDSCRFRSRIDMQRFRFGRGEYQYFAYPLPDLVAELRAGLYRGLRDCANRWMDALRMPAAFPPEHAEFLETCHAKGQQRPTPLLLRYREGDFNCLHQDVYGDAVFPFQAIVSLSEPGVDYDGGELILVEQQPRAQSTGHVITPRLGEAVAITTRYRPAAGKRGFYRTNMRHGVSTIRRGDRYTLGVIFHDAE